MALAFPSNNHASLKKKAGSGSLKYVANGGCMTSIATRRRLKVGEPSFVDRRRKGNRIYLDCGTNRRRHGLQIQPSFVSTGPSTYGLNIVHTITPNAVRYHYLCKYHVPATAKTTANTTGSSITGRPSDACVAGGPFVRSGRIGPPAPTALMFGAGIGDQRKLWSLKAPPSETLFSGYVVISKLL